MKSATWSRAAIAASLLAGVVSVGTPAKAGGCTVTVYTTKADGTIDGSVPGHSQPCGPGEENGGIEWYNPYTDKRVNYIPPGAFSGPSTGLIPLAPLDGGASSSSGNVTSGSPATSCTPTVTGGTKFSGGVTVRPGAPPNCPAGAPTVLR